jgi:hypothetical protein
LATNASSATTYLSVTEFLKLCDKRTVARWASDTGTALESGDISSDGNVAKALLAASGELESACLVSGRYTAAELAALEGATAAKRDLLLTWIAEFILWARRPALAREDGPPWVWELAQADLERLRSGQRLFAQQENIDAGVLDHDTHTAAEVENWGGITTQMGRFFGTRVNRSNG